MKKAIFAVVIFALASSGIASASERCNEPMSEWQPRNTLKQKLEEEGWKVLRIKSDDGCYEAKAIDSNGVKVEAYFNPKTLEIIKIERES